MIKFCSIVSLNTINIVEVYRRGRHYCLLQREGGGEQRGSGCWEGGQTELFVKDHVFNSPQFVNPEEFLQCNTHSSRKTK